MIKRYLLLTRQQTWIILYFQVSCTSLSQQNPNKTPKSWEILNTCKYQEPFSVKPWRSHLQTTFDIRVSLTHTELIYLLSDWRVNASSSCNHTCLRCVFIFSLWALSFWKGLRNSAFLPALRKLIFSFSFLDQLFSLKFSNSLIQFDKSD